MIAGFERLDQVVAQIEALEREKLSVTFPGHLEAIEAQVRVFEKERKRMLKTGEGAPPSTGNRAKGTLAWTGGPWNSGTGPAR